MIVKKQTSSCKYIQTLFLLKQREYFIIDVSSQAISLPYSDLAVEDLMTSVEFLSTQVSKEPLFLLQFKLNDSLITGEMRQPWIC